MALLLDASDTLAPKTMITTVMTRTAKPRVVAAVPTLIILCTKSLLIILLLSVFGRRVSVRVTSVGCRVSDPGCQVSGVSSHFGSQVSGFGYRVSGCRVSGVRKNRRT